MNLQVSTEVQKECKAWLQTSQYLGNVVLTLKQIVQDQSQELGTPSQSKHRPGWPEI